MNATKMFAMLSALVGICVALGCEGGSDGDNDTGSAGSYAGTWTGNVCGRGLTMILTQDGTSLSGTYALTDPDFSENLSGNVASATPPASASLIGGGDRHFEITFNSFNAFSGGYFKGSTQVCDTAATK